MTNDLQTHINVRRKEQSDPLTPPHHHSAPPIHAVTNLEGLGRMEQAGCNLGLGGTWFRWRYVVCLCVRVSDPGTGWTASDYLCGGEREKGEDKVGVRDGRGND